MLELRRLDFGKRADFELWQDYVTGRPEAHCADLAEWRLLFAALYGFDNHSWVCHERGRLRGALSLYHVRSPFLGRMLLTCPFFGRGGFYFEDDAARDALLGEAATVARDLGVDYIEVRSLAELPAPFRANTDFAEFDLRLAATAEQTWTERLSSNARQNVRSARRHDLEFRLSDRHEACFALLCRTLRAHGTPFHGERFFELLGEHLGSRVRYSEVWHGARLVAGGVVIRFRRTILTPYIGSLERDRSMRPNYLQYWGLIEHCAAEGIERFEMGRSPRGSTHARFKKKWGCEEVPLVYSYRVVDPRGRYRSVSRPSAIQRLAAWTWKRLPLAVTATVGPRLFRHIP